MHRRQFLAAPIALAAAPAWAEGFPTRPVRWVCYQAPGGTMDLTMRAVQPYLAQQGVRTQLDYVPGGSGTVARTQLYYAPPDGYMIITDSAPTAALNEALNHGAFSSRAFEPLYAWSIEGWQICAKKGSPVGALKQLAALGAQRPIIAGSIGRGGGSHLQLILLQKALGVPFNIVHFSGSAQAYPQVIGGNIDIACTGPGSASRNAEQLSFLCVFRDTEAALPGVPSARAQGYDVPSIDQIWYAEAPPKTPADRLATLEAAFDAASRSPDFAAAQAKAGLVSVEHVGAAELRRKLDAGFDLATQYAKDLA
jgi:tripartite-type tricarboxylate transporter receptor subunit TctC